jgi:hypothetical protein
MLHLERHVKIFSLLLVEVVLLPRNKHASLGRHAKIFSLLLAKLWG